MKATASVFNFLYRDSVQAAIARRHRNRLFRTGASLAQWYLDAINNTSGSIQSNGEAWLVGQVAHSIGLSVVFDVGANQGNWTATVLRSDPRARVHAFEVITSLRDALRSNADIDQQRVTVHGFGLGLDDHSETFTFDPTALGAASSVRTRDSYSESAIPIEAMIRAGDSVATELGIDHIDLLKIDVEGAEGQVLQGFSDMISRQRIAVIQFEYGNASGEAHFLMSDLFQFFHRFGYVIGKLFPTSIRFNEIKPEDSEFRRSEGNWVAVTPATQTLLGGSV